MGRNLNILGCTLVVIALTLVLLAGDMAPANATTPTKTWMDASIAPAPNYGSTVTFKSLNSIIAKNRLIKQDNCNFYAVVATDQFGDTTSGEWCKTNIGLLGQDGYVWKPKDSEFAGCINQCQTRIVITPNPNAFLIMTDNPDGTASISLRTPDSSHVAITPPKDPSDPSGISEIAWTDEPSYQPVDDNGNPINVDDDSLYTSAVATNNGKWLLLWDGSGFFTRINLDTFQSVSAKVPVQNDSSIFAELSITDDGRYVATDAIPDTGPQLWITDLDNCSQSNSGLMTDPLECNSRSLTFDLNNHDLNAFRFPKFINENLLRIYVNNSYDDGYDSYFIQAPNTRPTTNYIALGDSYASGEGTFDYFSPTNSNYNSCHLSPKSYPYLLQRTLDLDSTHSVACSGAKIVNINGDEFNAAQFDSRKRPKHTSLDPWLPGYKKQLDFINTHHPDVSTISIGGNDIGFKHIILMCITPGTCYKSYEDRMGLALDINSQFDRLVNLYESIKDNSAPGAKLYVVGYPQIITADGNCGHFGIGLNSSETEFANELIGYLDDVIQQAAEKAGVGFINTENTFDGHRLCSGTDEPAVNGISQRDPLHASYHPTKLGHLLLAGSIISETKNLTSPMPTPDRSIKEPDMDHATLLLDAPKSGEAIRKTMFDNSTRNLVVRDKPINGELQGSDYNLKPNTSYSVSIHSTPEKLGTVTTDGDGQLKYSLKIPSDIKPGFHTIHVYGEDAAGQPIDIQRTVYLVPSESDLDNIKNSKDQVCQILGLVGTDVNNASAANPCADNTNDPTISSSSTHKLHAGIGSGSALSTITANTKPLNTYHAEPTSELSEELATPPSNNKHTTANKPETSSRASNQKRSSNHIYLAGVIVLAIILLISRIIRRK